MREGTRRRGRSEERLAQEEGAAVTPPGREELGVQGKGQRRRTVAAGSLHGGEAKQRSSWTQKGMWVPSKCVESHRIVSPRGVTR